MKRVISFSLYGHDPRYTWGAVRNARLALQHYPDWICRFYVPEDYNDKAIADLMEFENVEIAHFQDGIPPMMQRFMVADDESVERFIVRDADSRLSAREAAAVQQWIEEDTILHVMRDHPAHQPIPGGLWGAMWRRPNWAAPRMQDLLETFLGRTKQDPTGYQVDQDFLITMVWGWAHRSSTQHDSSPSRRQGIGGRRFPLPRNPWPRFCGEVVMIGENGEDTYRDGDVNQVPKDDE